jgi:hypothetical protein
MGQQRELEALAVGPMVHLGTLAQPLHPQTLAAAVVVAVVSAPEHLDQLVGLALLLFAILSLQLSPQVRGLYSPLQQMVILR